MKTKILTLLMVLGVITSEANPKYRIETWVDNGVKYYLPQKKYGIEQITLLYQLKYGKVEHFHFKLNLRQKKLSKIGNRIIKQN